MYKYDDSKLNVLYEDNHIIVVIKPAGVLSQGDDTGDPDMVSILKKYIKEKYNKPGNVFVGLVHRLDRMVGGVMVFARTSKGASRLSDVIRRREFHKRYYAVLSHAPDADSANLYNYLEKDHRNNKVRVFDEPAGNAKPASLDYKIIGRSGELALADVELHTGRPHQIRAQFAHIGCALAGDAKYGKDSKDVKYGSKKPDPIKSPALWSYGISFKHPVKDEIMTFQALPPLEETPWDKFTDDLLIDQ